MVQVTGNNFNRSDQLEQDKISIRLSTDGFSFYSYPSAKDEAVSVVEHPVDESETLTVNFKQWIESEAVLSRPYTQVNLLLADSRYTLVPEELYEDTLLDRLFYLNHPKNGNEQLLTNHLEQDKIFVLFSVEKTLCDYIRNVFPEARIYAHISALCTGFSKLSRFGNNRKLYLNFRPSAVDLCCYEYGKLLLANTFSYSQNSDIIYYVLYTWKKLNLDQQKDGLYLTGVMTENKPLLEELKKYIRNISILHPDKNFDLQTTLTL